MADNLTRIRSILDGVDDLMDSWLGLQGIGQPPQYRHRATLLRWRGGSPMLSDPGLFLAILLDRIEANWRQAQLTSTTRPSRENWRFSRRTHIDPANASPEVTLERAAAALSHAWANQVPIASGLTGPPTTACGTLTSHTAIGRASTRSTS